MTKHRQRAPIQSPNQSIREQKSVLRRKSDAVAIARPDLILSGKVKYPWLYYVESEGMYCRWCKAHSAAGRGRTAWTSKPCISYREDKIKAHMRSYSHKLASEQQAQAEESARSGGIRQSFETSVTVERKAFIAALKIMHWLAKEEIAHTTKFESLISLAVSIGVKELNYLSKGGNAKYMSERTTYEIIEVLSATVEEEILQEISASPLISILCDESTDIAILKELVVYVRYIKNGDIVTRFLKIQDLLDGRAITIEAALIDILSKLQIPLEKVTAFGSDGAAVMVGRRNGVATKLKDRIPHLVAVHCVAHRLALATAHASDSIAYIKKYSITLQTIYYFFQNSSVRMAHL